MRILSIITAAAALMLSPVAQGQSKYFTKTGTVHFFSSTPVEHIEATNYKAVSIVDFASGDMDFSMLVMGFEFKKALMQEHFNENYMESPKFPKASFKGKITDPAKVNLTKDGTYATNITGKMTIHGVTKDVTTTGTFTVKSGKITGSSVFNIAPEDYNIIIPGAVKDKIAKQIKVTVTSVYEAMPKK